MISLLSACTNSTEEFCDELAKKSDLKGLVTALSEKNLGEAKVQARKFGELSDRSPEEIRVDMQSIAQSVLDIIDLLEKDTGQGTVPGKSTDSSSETDLLRRQLNDRFDDLARRSANVNRWASEKCGLKLS